MSVVENGTTRMLVNSTWQVDPALSAVEFRVRHLMIATVKGRFREFDGAIVPGEVPTIAGSIKVANVETFDERRDEYLRSPLNGVFRGTGLDPDEEERIALMLRSELDRTDFGLRWNRALETGGVLFGNAVELALDVSAVRVD
jgi:polyisoprenoid-binding protein YceI